VTWKPIEDLSEFHDLAEKFHKAMHEMFGNISNGTIGDNFGGTILFAYVPSVSSKTVQPYFEQELKRVTAILKDETLVEDLALKARQHYQANLPHTVQRAARELGYEALSPLYEKAGIKPKWTDIHYENNDYLGVSGKETIIKREVRDGVTVSRTVKQMRAGRPPGKRRLSRVASEPKHLDEFSRQLKRLAKSYEGEYSKRLTAPIAAKRLGFGSERTMQRRLRGWGEDRRFNEILDELKK
jgi:hypothetical protein